jgi:hypothetical protein
MDSEESRRESAHSIDEGSGWTTTQVAAKSLGVSRRTVQDYIHRGLLQAKAEGEGVKRTFYVSIDSLNALRAERLGEGNVADSSPEMLGEGVGEAMRKLAERLADESARAAELRTRLELTAQTESTLRESLERERQRVDAERERAEQERREREQIQEEARRLREKLEEARRPWWRRWFG